MNPGIQDPIPEKSEKDGKVIKAFSSFPIYAFLLPVAPVMLIFSGNSNRIPIDALLSTALVFVACYFVVTLIARTCFKPNVPVDLMLAALFIGFFVNFNNLESGQFIWFVIWLLVAVIIALVKKSREDFHSLFSALSVGAVIAGGVVALIEPTFWYRGTLQDAAKNRFPAISSADSDEQHPRDIYYIVLDRYARADQLQELYGFDNSGFLNALKQFGFLVADNAYSNYQRTAHSLSSSLNMDYLDNIGGQGDDQSSDWVPIYQRIQDSRLVSFLQSKGYNFQFFGTWWEPTRRNKNADVAVNFRAWPELSRVILENSVLGQTGRAFQIEDLDPRAFQCTRAKTKFAAMHDLPTKESGNQAKFVFAHFLVPHPPYVIDENGNCLSTETVASRTREENYIQQVKYANSQILKFLKQIKSAPGPKPIIVLQADEGPWPKKYSRDEIYRLGQDVSDVDWQAANVNELREKMGILNALYLPENETEISANMTPVNNFRKVLSAYFDADLPALPDRSYIFPNNSNLYQFIDVTDKLMESSP